MKIVSESCSVMSDSLQHHGLYSPGILHPRILERVAVPFSRGFFQPRVKPRSPTLQMVSLPAEPQGKPKNPGVGSLSSPADLPDAGMEMGFPALQADSLPTEL